MNDTPSKAAIERRKELTRDAMTALRLDYEHAIEHAFARHLDQVSEAAKYGQAFIEQALASFVFDEPTADLAYKAEEGLRGLILPDPEPDVLAELKTAFDQHARDIAPSHSLGMRSHTETRESAMLRLNERIIETLRGYAITPLKDAEA